MVRLELVRKHLEDSAVLDIQVSTVDELPDIGDEVEGYKIAAGSIAQIVQTGGWYTLDADEKWYDTDGVEAGGTPALNMSRFVTPVLTKTVITEEPEVDEDELLRSAESR